jgi:hypothetical protein
MMWLSPRHRSATPNTATSSRKRPLPEGVFADIATAYTAHDDFCLSLPDFWLGRTGGVSNPGDLSDCTGCGHTFYNEGLVWVNYEDPDPDADEQHYCGCCAVARGYRVHRTPYGLSTTDTTHEPDTTDPTRR